ncbi:MAG: MFS transporter, partial [Actinoallomurus sp.]
MSLSRPETTEQLDRDAQLPGRHEWRVLAVVLTASVMASFDLFVVNIAMPDIRGDLHAGDGAVELVVSGYAFAYAAGLITGGRMGDRFGYRRMFATGVAGFTVASLLCALAQTAGELVAARIVQGLTAALMVPQVLSLITVTFGASHRGRATAWYGVAIGLAGLAGQIGGGLLLDWDLAGLGWRLIFLVNVPVGCVAVPVALGTLPSARGRAARLDPVGAAAVTAVMVLILVPLAVGREQGWPLWVWICMAAAALATPALLAWQAAVGRRGAEPIINTRLFTNRPYTLLLVACALFQLYFGCFMFTLSLLLQVGLGQSAVAASVVFLCQGVLFTATSLSGGRLAVRHGRRVPVIGAVLVVVGLIALAAVLTADHPGMVELIAALGVVGAGNGFLLPPLLGAALARVRAEDAGAASGTLNTAQQFANSLGVTVIGTVFFAVAGAGVAHAAAAMQVVIVVYAVLVLGIVPLVQ